MEAGDLSGEERMRGQGEGEVREKEEEVTQRRSFDVLKILIAPGPLRATS